MVRSHVRPLMNKNWYIFLAIWSLAIFVAVFTILNSGSRLSLNLFQRLSGLILYVLLTTQIVIGTFMQYLTDKVGGKIFRFHITEGIVAYTIMFAHAVTGSLQSGFSLYYNFGRIAFILFSIGVFAGLLRTKTKFLRIHWKKLHILNYFAFLFVVAHSWFVGSDTQLFPFIIIWYMGLIVVLGCIGYKLFRLVPVVNSNKPA